MLCRGPCGQFLDCPDTLPFRFFPSRTAYAFFWGTVLPFAVFQCKGILWLSASSIHTKIYVTHINILTPVFSKRASTLSSQKNRAVCYPSSTLPEPEYSKKRFRRQFNKSGWSWNFGAYHKFLYIFGAMSLDQWAPTLSSKDGCF